MTNDELVKHIHKKKNFLVKSFKLLTFVGLVALIYEFFNKAKNKAQNSKFKIKN